jgi:hypothetical protein
MNMRKDRRFFSPAVKCAMAMGLATALLSGCLGSGATAPAGTPAAPAGARLEPSASETGVARVASVNTELGFAVVDFATQTMPPVGTRVNVYRGGKRVGTVRITEPVRAPLATADVVDGEVRVGDEAR